MTLPVARGLLSNLLIDALQEDDPERLPQQSDFVDIARPRVDPLTDDDLQLALWTCYELHYRGFSDVADRWEWQPELIRFRGALEGALLLALRRDVRVHLDGRAVAEQLWALVDGDDGPTLSRYMQKDATLTQFLEFVIHRSIYQLKEADPHTWAIPRLDGAPKSALVDIQMGEYGTGNPAGMHSELYRTMMRHLQLDPRSGGYVNAVPGITLAISNVMSLFGLHRRWRGALVGHLAAYEMTSSTPCRRYGKGLRRLGAPDEACAFYDAHVTADALHEQIAAHDMCGGLARAEPSLAEQILFGAAVCLHVDNRFAEHVLDSWQRGVSSLIDFASVPSEAAS
jgi:hypothetical protein